MPNRLDRAQYPNLASIETMKFRLGLKGYNVSEVAPVCREGAMAEISAAQFNHPGDEIEHVL